MEMACSFSRPARAARLQEFEWARPSVCLFVRGRRTGASAGRMSYYRRSIAGMGALAVLVGVRLVAHAY
jgi:hypothetical protein